MAGLLVHFDVLFGDLALFEIVFGFLLELFCVIFVVVAMELVLLRKIGSGEIGLVIVLGLIIELVFDRTKGEYFLLFLDSFP